MIKFAHNICIQTCVTRFKHFNRQIGVKLCEENQTKLFLKNMFGYNFMSLVAFRTEISKKKLE